MYQKHDNFTRVGVLIANVLLIVLALELYVNQNATIVVGPDSITTVSVTSTSYLATTLNYTTTSVITNTETATYTPSPILLSQTGVRLPSWQEPFAAFNFKVEAPYSRVLFTFTIYTDAQKPSNSSIVVRYQIGTINEDIGGQGERDIAQGMGLGNSFTLNLKSHSITQDTYIDFQIVGQ